MGNKLSELSKPVAQAYYDEHDSSTMRIDWLVDYAPEAAVLYSQEYVSALISQIEADREIKARLCRESNSLHDRLKAAEKRIAELERERDNWQAATLAMRDSWREERAELEAKLATPVRLLGEMLVHDWEHSVGRQAAFQHRKIAWDARLAEDKKAILAAGFTFTVEGDE